MKLAILKVINGNYFVHAEGMTSIEQAKIIFHGLCQTLWNAQDVTTAQVMIVDEQLDCVEGYKEFIHHEPMNPEPIPIEDEVEPDGE